MFTICSVWTEPAAGTSSQQQVDLFGNSLVGDLLDMPAASDPTETSTMNNSTSSEVDLFADASFVSAPPSQVESGGNSETQVSYLYLSIYIYIYINK